LIKIRQWKQGIDEGGAILGQALVDGRKCGLINQQQREEIWGKKEKSIAMIY